ncbi:unnamed protein product [Phyllotreta striolata]|uniref:Uncharacterized protein n=1 Tax=Phyllotreta striolata TaxID=444603 RepID=A0A9P0GTK7_PHYSR|nr:unnamed protein product [Phyllotreta striolata]
MILMLIITLALFKTGHSLPHHHIFKDLDPLLVYDNEVAGNSNNLTIKADKGVKVEEYAIFKPGKNPDQGVLEVNGTYEYLDEEGNEVQYFYEYNKNIQNGPNFFTPSPPIPPAFKTLYELLKIPEENQQKVVSGFSK